MVVQADTATGTTAPPAVHALAAELLPQSAELAREMNDHLFAMMPELRERDDGELRAETLASCEVNIAQVLRLQKLGVGPGGPLLPVEAAGWARSLVRRGITLATLLRAYRLGHAWLWDRWSQLLHERVPDGEEFVAAEQQSSAFMFAYIDLISNVLAGGYGPGREGGSRSPEQLRAEPPRATPAREPLDGGAA